MAKKAKTWGGAREGAGRKPTSESGPKVQRNFWITPEADARLRELEDAAGLSRSALLERWILRSRIGERRAS